MASDEIGFVDGIVAAVKELFASGAQDLHTSVQELLGLAIGATLRTPYPTPEAGFFFGQPSSEPWISLFAYYNEIVLPITVLMIGSAIALVMFAGTFGNLLTGYERSRGKRRLFLGFLVVLAWWGIGSFTLRFADALAVAIAPDPNSIAANIGGALTIQGSGIMMQAVLATAEAAVVLGVLVWFLLRWVGIYAFMLGMPIAVAIWIAGVGGPLRYLSDIAEGLALKFVPLAFIPVPAAIVYRVGDLLFQTIEGPTQFGHPAAAFSLALGFPLLTLVVSYYFFFKSPRLSGASAVAERAERTAIETGREIGERLPSPETGRGPSAPAGGGAAVGASPAATTAGATDERSEEVAAGGGPRAPEAVASADVTGAASDVRSYEDPETARGFGSSREGRFRRDLQRSRDKIRRLRRRNP